MEIPYLVYEMALGKGYASREMRGDFGDGKKFTTWRWLRVIFAKVQKELGIAYISDEQTQEMTVNIENIDLDLVQEEETRIRHDGSQDFANQELLA